MRMWFWQRLAGSDNILSIGINDQLVDAQIIDFGAELHIITL